MENIDLLKIFQGIATLAASEPEIIAMRLFLIALGMLLIYLGHKGILESLLMIPMGLGMASINAGVLFLEDGRHGNLFVDPLAEGVAEVMTVLQIDWLQPIYTLTFSNGLIACVVFMGIGSPARHRLCHGTAVSEHVSGALRRARHGRGVSAGLRHGALHQRTPRPSPRSAAPTAR